MGGSDLVWSLLAVMGVYIILFRMNLSVFLIMEWLFFYVEITSIFLRSSEHFSCIKAA